MTERHLNVRVMPHHPQAAPQHLSVPFDAQMTQLLDEESGERELPGTLHAPGAHATHVTDTQLAEGVTLSTYVTPPPAEAGTSVRVYARIVGPHLLLEGRNDLGDVVQVPPIEREALKGPLPAPGTRQCPRLPRRREWEELTRPGGVSVLFVGRYTIDIPLDTGEDRRYSVVESHCDGAATHVRDATLAQAHAIARGIRDYYVASGITERWGHARFSIFGPSARPLNIYSTLETS